MSLEDIDKKFDKVAKQLGKSDDTNQQNTPPKKAEQPKKKLYEDITNSQVSPLLQKFAEHLKNNSLNSSSDEEFQTISLDESDVIPVQTDIDDSSVSEEEINSLLKFSKQEKINEVKKQTNISDIVYTQQRYGDIHPPPQNIASFDDLNVKYSNSENNIVGPDTKPSTSDTQIGLQPVNFSEKFLKDKEKEKELNKNIVELPNNSDINDNDNDIFDPTASSSDNVPKFVLDSVKKHRSKKTKSSSTDDSEHASNELD